MAGQPARAWAGESQFASDTVDETERVAKERVHAERLMAELQLHKKLLRTIKLNQMDLASREFRVVCGLLNCKAPLVSDEAL